MSGTISEFIDGVVDGSLPDEDVISWLVGGVVRGRAQWVLRYTVTMGGCARRG